MLKPTDKIINSFYKISVYVLYFLSSSFISYAQDTAVNKYGLRVIYTVKDYRASIKNDTSKEMVDLKKLVPALAIDLKYAGHNNFTKTKLYPALNTTFLRLPVAMALAAAQKDLKKQGLGLKIFDAYRPYSVTEKMWELIKDDRYAANPKNGSGHNRGISVDLTLINLHTKRALNMGTEFDNFSDTAHHDFTPLPEQASQNRLVLRTVMEKYGFKALQSEWWHYSFTNGTVYELLDIDFDELRKNKSPVK